MDCLEYLNNRKKMDEKNLVCKKCNKKRTVYCSKEIKTFPKTLIFSLNKNELKNGEKIIIKEKLHLKKNNINFDYNLIAAIKEIGLHHFISYCKNGLNNWYMYDDEKVEESSFIEINSNTIPSILFFCSDNIPKFK